MARHCQGSFVSDVPGTLCRVFAVKVQGFFFYHIYICFNNFLLKPLLSENIFVWIILRLFREHHLKLIITFADFNCMHIMFLDQLTVCTLCF